MNLMARRNAAPTILKAAEICLIKGDGDFEMNDVAKAAGVSEGLAYHYYKSKAGLISAIIEDFFRRYNAVANERMDGDQTWHIRERRRLMNVIGFLYSDPLAPIILGKMSSSGEAAGVEARLRAEMIELSGRNIADGIKRGFIPSHVNARIAGAAITGAMRHTFIFAMSQKVRPSAAELADQLWALIAGALELSAAQ